MTPRVGFLGAGLIATYHSKSLHVSRADASWAGVFDPDRARAEAFAAASGATVCDTEDDVLDSCDAVYICTWTSEHERLVRAACSRGLAVFCEKPLSTSLAGARAMVSCVEDAGVTNQVGLVLRASPAFDLARALIAAPESGRVMSIVFRDDQFIPVQGMYGSTWRSDVARAGAGALLEHSIHDVDLIETLVGPIASVNGRSAAMHGIEGIEDTVVAGFALVGGGLGTLVSVWHDLLARPSLRRVEVLCERAFVSVEHDWFGPVSWTRDGDRGSVEGDALLAELERHGGAAPNPDAAFVAAVAAGGGGGGVGASPSFRDALRAHEVVDAIYRSAAAGGAPIAV
jgi:myo-inositol 2-dehydrogenase/D-chiro-inositol 1-dehydrogenase